MHFPRGTPIDGVNTRTATAQWANLDEIYPHSFESGDILLGYVDCPHRGAQDAIKDVSEVLGLLQASSLDIETKSDLVHSGTGILEHLKATAKLWIGAGDDRHVACIAGSRSGKTASILVPSLCFYPGSVCVIDPKGELARLTAVARGPGSEYSEGRGQSVFVLDPYDVSGVPEELKGSFNPLALIDASDSLAVDKASSIAEGLVQRPKSEDAHFDDMAQSLIKALILYVAVSKKIADDARNLVSVYRLLSFGAKEIGIVPDENETAISRLLLELEDETEPFHGTIAAIAATLGDMGDREYGSVLSTAKRNLAFIERGPIAKVLSKSSFNLGLLKSDAKGVSIYLCLPPARMIDCGRWLRTMISSVLEWMYQDDRKPKSGFPLIMMLEEMATLGHMQVIEQAAGYAAGYHVKLMMVIQDIPQIKQHYPKTYETLLGNAGTVIGFGNSDETTLKYLAARLGEIEVVQTTMTETESGSSSSTDPSQAQQAQMALPMGHGLGRMAGPLIGLLNQKGTGLNYSVTTNLNQQRVKTPLMTADEIERHFRRETMQQIVSIKGANPMAIKRANYFDEVRFLGGYEPDLQRYQDGEKPPKKQEAEKLRARHAQEQDERLQFLLHRTQVWMKSVEEAQEAFGAS